MILNDMEKKKMILIAAMAAAMLATIIIVFAVSGKTAPEAPPDDAGEPWMSVTGLRCGAADAFIIIKDRRAAVIDCGERDDGGKVVAFLRLKGIETVDYLIISHFDKDHVGGAAEVVDNLEVKEVYVTYQSKDSDASDDFFEACDKKGIAPVTVTDETVLDFSSGRTNADGSVTAAAAKMIVYPPDKDDYGKGTSNNSSLAVMLSDFQSGKSMFFTGDAENKRIKELINIEHGIKCDVLKVPHHGRYTARLIDLINKCSPSYAVITCSASAPEDTETMEKLNNKGVETYLTRNGNVTFDFYFDRIAVSQ